MKRQLILLIMGGFITFCYGQSSKSVVIKNVAKAAVGKGIIDGAFNQKEIPHGDNHQIYKNDTNLKGIATIPQTSQIEIEKIKKENREFMSYIKKLSSPFIIPKTKYDKEKQEYQTYIIKGGQYLKDNDTLHAVRHFISADSIVLKHNKILKDKKTCELHSNILLFLSMFYTFNKNNKDLEKALSYVERTEFLKKEETVSELHLHILCSLGMFYFTDQDHKNFEKALYYFEQAELLGDEQAGTFANATRRLIESNLKLKEKETNNEINKNNE